MSIMLYEHNRVAYESALSMLKQTGKAAIVHPTGTGKSFIGFKLCEDSPDKTVLWLSPSEYIFKTQLENLKAAGGDEPKNIRFYTYAKLMNMSEDEIKEIKPDFCVYDEYHRTGAAQWQLGVQRFLKLFPNVPILGLTATAIRYLDNQRDMSEELFDGNVASEMTLGEAIVRGILNPPKYVLSVFSYQKDLEKYERRVRATKSKATRDVAEKYLEALRRSLDKAEGLDVIFDKHMTDRTGKYIVFCANKEHMDEMIEKSRKWFAKVDKKPHIYSVYTVEPGADKVFEDFKRDNDQTHLRLLFCIDALNEGIHVENVSGVILLRPTISPIIYKQQIGRALSASKKNDAVIFDVVMNIENLYSLGEIEDEMQIATAYYRALGEESYIVNERFHVIDEIHDCIELFNKLNDTLTASWDIMYGYAKAYFERYGNLEISSRHRTEDGYSLGAWIHRQRGIRNGTLQGKLTEKQIEKLDQIGMIWEDILDLRWERNYNAAKKYYEENGNLSVPASYITQDGITLGNWICSLRTLEKANARCGYLTAERKRKLEEIGMIWDVLDYYWERNYFAACEFYKEHGHLNVPVKYVSKDGVRLGAWLSNQRKLRSGTTMRGTPPSESQIQRLDAIGMDWRPSIESRWDTLYKEAVKYADEHGDLLVPLDYVTKSGLKLGVWIVRQRLVFRRGKISDERKDKLDRLGMRWREDDPWLVRYEAVKKYLAEHGTILIPQAYVVNNLWIGKWLHVQKKAYDAGKLDPEKRKLLEQLPLHELERENQWDRVFADLKEYHDQNGGVNVPKEYTGKSGTNLNTWLITQRRKKRLGELTDEQIAALDSLGFSWESPIGWEKGCRCARAYYEQNGDLDVPFKYICKDGFRLGAWVSARRKEYINRDPELTAERVKMLSDLGMEWAEKTKWDKSYDRAKNYAKVHGALPKKETAVNEEEKAIATWLSSQRQRFLRGDLTARHIEKLKMLAPEIVKEPEPPFEVGLRHAQEYRSKNGNLNVPSNYQCEDGYYLGSWLSSQRKKKSELTPDQISSLDALGMIWEKKTGWQLQFEKAKQYYTKHGYLPKTPSACENKEEANLYQWLKLQRQHAKNGELSDEKIQLLDSIGMEWRDPNEQAWDRGYEKAVEYYNANGNLNVAVAFVCEDGYPLGEWLHTQRKSTRTLSAQRQDKLEKLNAIKV